MTRTAPCLLIATLLMTPAARAASPRTCHDDESAQGCLDRLLAEDAGTTPSTETAAPGEAKEELGSGLKSALFSRTTGPDLAGPTLGSVIRDLVPLFKIAAESGELGGDEPSAGVELNLPLFGEGDRDFQIRAVLHEPSLFEPLRTALPAATREERADALEATLDDLADYSAVLTWNRTSQRFGRGVSRHISDASAMFDELVARAEARWRTQRPADPGIALAGLLQVMELEPDIPFSRIAESKGSAVAEALKQRVVELYEGEIELDTLVGEEAARTRFFRFADLINNQPQLNVTIERRSRDDLAGPDETALMVSFEVGFHNVNSFCKWCGARKQESQLECLQSYVSAREPGLAAGNRMSFSLEVSKSDDYDISLPDDMVDLEMEFGRKISAVLAYGRYLVVDESGHDKARLDLAASYEEFGDDMRQDRSVASLTYTQKVTDGVSFIFGLSWANKEEFLSETDDRINAHVGLSYKLLGADSRTAGKGTGD